LKAVLSWNIFNIFQCNLQRDFTDQPEKIQRFEISARYCALEYLVELLI